MQAIDECFNRPTKVMSQIDPCGEQWRGSVRDKEILQGSPCDPRGELTRAGEARFGDAPMTGIWMRKTRVRVDVGDARSFKEMVVIWIN
jgi:hypothetical protein